MRRFRVAVLLFAATIFQAKAQNVTYRGVYVGTSVYRVNDVVQFGVYQYISLVDANTANEPDISPTDWMVLQQVTAFPYILGPKIAPSGACIVYGAWVFSQDGHGTFCSDGTWITKI